MSTHKEPKLEKIVKTFFYDIHVDLVIIFILALFAFRKPEPTFFYGACLFLTLASSAFWVMSRMHLGNSYSVKPSAVYLVKDGIYSKIRHPMYVFSTLAAFFIVLYLNSLLAYLAIAILILIQIERMKREDEILEKYFGGEYIDYKERTWF